MTSFISIKEYLAANFSLKYREKVKTPLGEGFVMATNSKCAQVTYGRRIESSYTYPLESIYLLNDNSIHQYQLKRKK